MCVLAQSLICVQHFATPWTVNCQSLLSMEFFRQEYWSVLLFLTPGYLPNPGTDPMFLLSPVLAGRFFTTSAPLRRINLLKNDLHLVALFQYLKWIVFKSLCSLHSVLYLFKIFAIGFILNGQNHSPCISSVQFSCSVVSDSLRPHESQHARPPCPSPTPGVHSDSRPSSQWCHPAISSSVVPFSSCLQSLPASESFPMSQLFSWGGQSTEVSALASFLPKNTQGWSLLEWTGWIS